MVSLPEVSRVTGIPRNTILRWIDVGYVRPAVRAHGRGDANLFSDLNVTQIRAVAAIVDAFGDGTLTPRVVEEALPKVEVDSRVVHFATAIPVP